MADATWLTLNVLSGGGGGSSGLPSSQPIGMTKIDQSLSVFTLSTYLSDSLHLGKDPWCRQGQGPWGTVVSTVQGGPAKSQMVALLEISCLRISGEITSTALVRVYVVRTLHVRPSMSKWHS